MLMTEYETTVVLRPDLGGDAVETTLDRVREVVKTGGGKLLAINHWGKKKLAYEIKKNVRGIYVQTQFLGPSNLVAELERNLRISENVLRYLTIQVAKGVDATAKEEKAYVRPSYEAEEVEKEEAPAFTAGEEYDEDGGVADDDADFKRED